MNILMNIKRKYLCLRKSERKVADYIINNFSKLESISIGELAKEAEVSQTTVIRFVQALGLDSFKEFKVKIIKDKARFDESSNDILNGLPISKDNDIKDIPYRMINSSIESLQDILKSIDIRQFEKAIKTILSAKNIAIFGVENSKVIMHDLAIKLLYLGKNCVLYDDYYLQAIAASNLRKGDVAIAISYTGMSKGTIEAVKAAKTTGATIILLTNFSDSKLVEYADILLCTSTKQFLYGDCIFSRIVQMEIVDMIYVGILLSDYDKFTSNMDNNSTLISGEIFN